jgi:hypothetical protein
MSPTRAHAMTIALSDEQTRQLRLRAQRLAPATSRNTDVVALVRAICGVQAQELPAASLSVRARTAELTAEDVERARVADRSIVHTWAMRGTLHLLATEDLGWLLPLLGPIFMAADRRRRAELGLDEETTTRGARALGDLLAARGPQTRAELAGPLAAQGIPVDGQALVHLIAYATLAGVVCHGPDRGAKPAYVLLSDWAQIGPALDPDTAAAELARRYLAAYGPATPEDLAAWSGLALNTARAAWQRVSGALVEVSVGDPHMWMLREQARWLDERRAAPDVRLLPAYDTLLLGYTTRELFVDPAHARRVHPGGGIIRPVMLAGGRASATWRSKRQRNRLTIVVEPFDAIAPDALSALEDEARDLGRFLGLAAKLEIAG